VVEDRNEALKSLYHEVTGKTGYWDLEWHRVNEKRPLSAYGGIGMKGRG
jgi:hypothetical protein